MRESLSGHFHVNSFERNSTESTTIIALPNRHRYRCRGDTNMQARRLAIFVVTVVAFPVGLAAQTIGFRVGIAAPPYGVGLAAQTITGFRVGIAAPPYGPGVPVGGVAGAYYGNSYGQNPYARPNHGFGNNPYTGAGAYNNPDTGVPTYNNPYTGVPRGGYILPTSPYAPTATVIGPGTVIFVGPGQKVAPGYTSPNRGSGVIFTNGPNPRSQVYYTGRPTGYASGSSAIPPGTDRIFVSGGGRNRGQVRGNPVITPGPDIGPPASVNGIGIGSTRAAVIAQFGRPTVSLADRNGEALVFGGTTILIQNGLVTRINSR
jgi:hypothetical protein